MYTRFKDNIWTVYLADAGFLSSKKCDFEYLLCVIDVFIKYASVKPLKFKKAATAIYVFIEIVNKSKHKPNKL